MKGLISFVPYFDKFIYKLGTGGTISARYCYAVWLRHLSKLNENNLHTDFKKVAELGPGDTIGIGLMSILTGAKHYYAFDVVEYIDVAKNLNVLNELILLLANKNPIPDNTEFPNLKPELKSYSFPDHILTDERIEKCLKVENIKKIKDGIVELNNKEKSHKDLTINYITSWNNTDTINKGSLDIIISQAVMEHIDIKYLNGIYKTMNLWLKENGIISHLIDYSCHGTAKKWNGHWEYSENIWKVFRGRRPYLLNRMPHSYHLVQIKNADFDIIAVEKYVQPNSIKHCKIIYKLLEEDLTAKSSLIQAVKN